MSVIQSCLTLCDPADCSPARLFRPRDSPRKNTGIGCHSLLQDPNPGIKLGSPALQADSLPYEPPGKPRQTTPVTGVAPTQITSWPSVCRQVCGILTRGEQSEHSCGRKFNLLMIRQEATHPPTFLLVVKVFLGPSQVVWASLVAQTIKNLPAMQETQV